MLSLLPNEVQLCFAHYQDSLDYFTLTVDAIANAVHQAIKITPEQEIDKVRGVKRGENDILIRLADALCGIIFAGQFNLNRNLPPIYNP